jgi:hypothetical protein
VSFFLFSGDICKEIIPWKNNLSTDAYAGLNLHENWYSSQINSGQFKVKPRLQLLLVLFGISSSNCGLL